MSSSSSPEPSKDTPFYKTPMGIGLIIAAVLVLLFIVMGLQKKSGGGHRPRLAAHNTRSHNSNANYFARGEVPPSLAGYI